MTAREEILARVRHALGPAPVVEEVVRSYHTAGAARPRSHDLTALLAERLADYRARVFPGTDATLAATVAAAVAAGVGTGRRARVGVPPGLPPAWLDDADDGIEAVVDRGLTTDDLDGLDGVVTGAALAIAQTGTIVLDGSPTCGRRALTLVPDLHVCVVTAAQVVATVPDAIARLEPTRPQTWVSGPSATSDIELDRVEGVHGPRTLHVVLVGG